MAVKELIAKSYAWFSHQKLELWKHRAHEAQNIWMQKLCREAAQTKFGKDHKFEQIRTAEDFKQAVPIRSYEDLRSYIDPMVAGEADMLWPGRPLYYAKTSGTTSGTKFIPISRQSMPYHIQSAKEALLEYIYHSKKSAFTVGKMIFLQGSPQMGLTNGVKTGRLSGIVAHYVPTYLQANRLPSYATNCIEDWENKLSAIVDETHKTDMRLISGIPPWVQMYFEYLLKKTGKSAIKEIFPNFSLFVTGGVNYEPYRAVIDQLVGKKVDMLETYPASEGFIAFNDFSGEDGLLLLADHGVYYEFIPLEEFGQPNASRLNLAQIELGKKYALIMSTNAGLWGYSIGDTVEFVSKRPYRLKVSGRVSHYISAFGEHVIGSEVDWAMEKACAATGASVIEFTVAPQVKPNFGLPYHEWFIAFDKEPIDEDFFALMLDEAMCKKNVYYQDLIKGKILRPAVIRLAKRDAFQQYMKSQGKLGGQNKLPRLSNDRKIADSLEKFLD